MQSVPREVQDYRHIALTKFVCYRHIFVWTASQNNIYTHKLDNRKQRTFASARADSIQ